jgi:hypothetical protein
VGSVRRTLFCSLIFFLSCLRERWWAASGHSFPPPDFFLLLFFSILSSWIQCHVEPQADSLLEQSARGEAEMWTKLDCVIAELEAMGDSPVGLPFKMAVAVYLRGKHLAEFI